MTEENRFRAESWWANAPEFVVETLTRQLEAAQAIWPELRAFKIVSDPPTVSTDKR